MRPEHLYKFAGLLFLLALLYRFFDPITRVLLIAFAAATLAVVFNAIIRAVPGGRRWIAALIGLLVLGAIGAALWFGVPVLADQVQRLVRNLPQLQRELADVSSWIRRQTGLDVSLIGSRTSGFIGDFLGSIDGRQVLGRARGVLEYLVLLFLVFFGALYAAAQPNERLPSPLLRAIPGERRPAFRRLFGLTGKRLLGWIQGTLLSMLIVGALSTLAFYLIGLDYALLLGVWAGITEFVPIVGPWVGGLTAVAVAFLGDPLKALYTLLAVLAIQQIESNVITPLVMAKVAEVHPFVTLFAIFLFGSLFGFLGVLLALPLVLLIWTIVQVLWVERAIHAGDDRIEPVVKG